jgi:uncharacterized protein with GYD domain
MLFIMSMNFTERGIREIKDDLMQIIETTSEDNIAKYALANCSLGFVRTRTARAWSLDEMTKIVSELP